VQQFFKKVQVYLAQLQTQVTQQIKNSKALSELETLLQESRQMVPQGQESRFDEEKRRFDQKIANGRFAYVVKRQEFY